MPSVQMRQSAMDLPVLTIRYVVVEPRPIEPPPGFEAARVEFWASVIIVDPNTFANDMALCEDRLKRTLGPSLADQLRPHFKRPPPGPFRLIARDISYGSLDVRIAIEGADNLLEAFAGNVQVFLDVLAQYAPQAFVASIPITPILQKPVRARLRDTEWLAEMDPGVLEEDNAQVTDPNILPRKLVDGQLTTTAMHQSGDPESGRQLISSYLKQKTDRALWLLANTSLVVPVLLSLVVVYFAFQALETERSRVERRSLEVDKRDAALRDAMLTREARMLELLSAQRIATAASNVELGQRSKP